MRFENSIGLERIHVLVVDDSALVREVMAAVLGSDRRITVATAADPLIATNRIVERRPDVIVLDLEMPKMSGLDFLCSLMRTDPIPVVICSGVAPSHSRLAIRALEEGAFDIVLKPRVGVGGFLQDSATRLIDVVWAAATSRPRLKRQAQVSITRQSAFVKTAHAPMQLSRSVVAIGASTGGTEALRQVLGTMPPDTPGIVVVQHMPADFTNAFAESLNRDCAIEVKEAEEGDWVRQGRALIAPGNRHLIVRPHAGGFRVSLNDGPLVSGHRPSVDVLFNSVAGSAASNAIGVIMTGMGVDGAEGLLRMRLAGAYTIAQDEASCVVFGMPQRAISRGAASRTVPLKQITTTILSIVSHATACGV